ncbi:DUF1772 domain-containing protein [Streptomyces luteolifulvus]|uniref:DUF1772 domain-containing protein n=1 Tax=Streptomyces luteolifulvus TaxID=2615112 RepID=A0A6H9UTE6_9ACTN|nr:anthrone oxygenase family protein [Streptomyces luteolifulvus]KAB1141859.1 DUF1772 domain-containing protein [Streptomyces luteolifulvus]
MTQNSTGRRTAAGGVLGAATVAMGLIAGVFYIFACAVMPAVARSDDRVYVEVVQNVNDVIQNPVFMLSLGALLLTAVSAWQLRTTSGPRGWVWAALAAYALAFLVTVAANIPLNNALARAADPVTARESFEDQWVAWNVVRTLLSTAALACLARALILYGGLQRRAGTLSRPAFEDEAVSGR